MDLYQLGIVDHPLTSSFAANASFGTDGRDGMTLRGVLGDLKVKDQQRSYAPGDVHVDLMSRRDTVHTSITAGDFHLSTAFNSSVNKLVKTGQRIAKTLQAQIENKRIDQPAILHQLPKGHFTLHSGRGNLFSNLLAQNGYVFRQADIELTSSPQKGLDGAIKVDSLVYDSLRIDDDKHHPSQ